MNKFQIGDRVKIKEEYSHRYPVSGGIVEGRCWYGNINKRRRVCRVLLDGYVDLYHIAGDELILDQGYSDFQDKINDRIILGPKLDQ